MLGARVVAAEGSSPIAIFGALPAGTKVYLALSPVDMRKGYDGLAALVQQVLQRDPFCGHLFLSTG